MEPTRPSERLGRIVYQKQEVNDERALFHGRYGSAKPDPISGERPKKLRYAAGGALKESSGDKYMPCYDPSTGAVIALAPQCTSGEVEEAIQAAASRLSRPGAKRRSPSASRCCSA